MKTKVQSRSYNHWKKFCSLFLILFFMVVSCQTTKKSSISDTAIRKQYAAEYYYEQKDYPKAQKLCEEAIASWKQMKKTRIKTAPEWAINNNITTCEYILDKCSEYNRGRLFVHTNPLGATVRVLNMGPRFHQQGMRLEPGKYNLEISAPGYETKIIWTELSAREDKRITVDLQTGKVAKVETEPSVIDNERRRLVEELERSRDEQELANIPRNMSGTRVSLRTEPKKLLERDIRKMLARYGFYAEDLNWRGYFANDFVDNGDGTITDRATGLMWQKSGSFRAKTWKRGRTYIQKLNKDKFAGYSDWRLPTVEELASLVEREKVSGVHINPIFDNKQKSCWSADTKRVRSTPGYHFGEYESWVVKFAEGIITMDQWSESKEVLRLYFNMGAEYYIRAVRSAN